jgi:hypothetical protein
MTKIIINSGKPIPIIILALQYYCKHPDILRKQRLNH